MLAVCVGLSFSRYLRPKNNDQKRGKKKRPALTVSIAGTCLSVVNFGNAPVPKVPRHLHQVNCFQEDMLEFNSPIGQCFSRFPTVSSRRRGEKGRTIRELTRRVNPNSHIPHLQAQLAFARHNRLVWDRRLSVVSWYSRCSQPTLQRQYEGVQGSNANTH